MKFRMKKEWLVLVAGVMVGQVAVAEDFYKCLAKDNSVEVIVKTKAPKTDSARPTAKLYKNKGDGEGYSVVGSGEYSTGVTTVEGVSYETMSFEVRPDMPEIDWEAEGRCWKYLGKVTYVSLNTSDDEGMGPGFLQSRPYYVVDPARKEECRRPVGLPAPIRLNCREL